MSMLKKKSYFFRVICAFLIFLLIENNMEQVQAQGTPFLPAPNYLIDLSIPYSLPVLRGIRVYPSKPFQFDFLVGSGNNQSISQKDTGLLVKYFLTCLTVPQQDLWVNLSPYEKDRIIPNELALTDAGNTLLLQDKLLKQLASSLTYPETALGQKFWKAVYQRAYEKFGTTNLPVETYNKVWIVPDKAVVYDMGNSALIAETHLKVMLEEDYLALKKHTTPNNHDVNNLHQFTAMVTREIILPQIEKEVNEGKHFAPVRQIFHSMILAAWYKQALRRSILSTIYVDKRKIGGVNDIDESSKEKIYQQYLHFYKVGAYNYIRDDVDPITQQVVPRKYFSGGVFWGDLHVMSLRVPNVQAVEEKLGTTSIADGAMAVARVNLIPDSAQVSPTIRNIGLVTLGAFIMLVFRGVPSNSKAPDLPYSTVTHAAPAAIPIATVANANATPATPQSTVQFDNKVSTDKNANQDLVAMDDDNNHFNAPPETKGHLNRELAWNDSGDHYHGETLPAPDGYMEAPIQITGPLTVERTDVQLDKNNPTPVDKTPVKVATATQETKLAGAGIVLSAPEDANSTSANTATTEANTYSSDVPPELMQDPNSIKEDKDLQSQQSASSSTPATPPTEDKKTASTPVSSSATPPAPSVAPTETSPETPTGASGPNVSTSADHQTQTKTESAPAVQVTPKQNEGAVVSAFPHGFIEGSGNTTIQPKFGDFKVQTGGTVSNPQTKSKFSGTDTVVSLVDLDPKGVDQQIVNLKTAIDAQKAKIQIDSDSLDSSVSPIQMLNDQTDLTKLEQELADALAKKSVSDVKPSGPIMFVDSHGNQNGFSFPTGTIPAGSSLGKTIQLDQFTADMDVPIGMFYHSQNTDIAPGAINPNITLVFLTKQYPHGIIVQHPHIEKQSATVDLKETRITVSADAPPGFKIGQSVAYRLFMGKANDDSGVLKYFVKGMPFSDVVVQKDSRQDFPIATPLAGNLTPLVHIGDHIQAHATQVAKYDPDTIKLFEQQKYWKAQELGKIDAKFSYTNPTAWGTNRTKTQETDWNARKTQLTADISLLDKFILDPYIYADSTGLITDSQPQRGVARGFPQNSEVFRYVKDGPVVLGTASDTSDIGKLILLPQGTSINDTVVVATPQKSAVLGYVSAFNLDPNGHVMTYHNYVSVQVTIDHDPDYKSYSGLKERVFPLKDLTPDKQSSVYRILSGENNVSSAGTPPPPTPPDQGDQSGKQAVAVTSHSNQSNYNPVQTAALDGKPVNFYPTVATPLTQANISADIGGNELNTFDTYLSWQKTGSEMGLINPMDLSLDLNNYNASRGLSYEGGPTLSNSNGSTRLWEGTGLTGIATLLAQFGLNVFGQQITHQQIKVGGELKLGTMYSYKAAVLDRQFDGMSTSYQLWSLQQQLPKLEKSYQKLLQVRTGMEADVANHTIDSTQLDPINNKVAEYENNIKQVKIDIVKLTTLLNEARGQDPKHYDAPLSLQILPDSWVPNIPTIDDSEKDSILNSIMADGTLPDNNLFNEQERQALMLGNYLESYFKNMQLYYRITDKFYELNNRSWEFRQNEFNRQHKPQDLVRAIENSGISVPEFKVTKAKVSDDQKALFRLNLILLDPTLPAKLGLASSLPADASPLQVMEANRRALQSRYGQAPYRHENSHYLELKGWGDDAKEILSRKMSSVPITQNPKLLADMSTERAMDYKIGEQKLQNNPTLNVLGLAPSNGNPSNSVFDPVSGTLMRTSEEGGNQLNWAALLHLPLINNSGKAKLELRKIDKRAADDQTQKDLDDVARMATIDIKVIQIAQDQLSRDNIAYQKALNAYDNTLATPQIHLPKDSLSEVDAVNARWKDFLGDIVVIKLAYGELNKLGVRFGPDGYTLAVPQKTTNNAGIDHAQLSKIVLRSIAGIGLAAFIMGVPQSISAQLQTPSNTSDISTDDDWDLANANYQALTDKKPGSIQSKTDQYAEKNYERTIAGGSPNDQEIAIGNFQMHSGAIGAGMVDRDLGVILNTHGITSSPVVKIIRTKVQQADVPFFLALMANSGGNPDVMDVAFNSINEILGADSSKNQDLLTSNFKGLKLYPGLSSNTAIMAALTILATYPESSLVKSQIEMSDLLSPEYLARLCNALGSAPDLQQFIFDLLVRKVSIQYIQESFSLGSLQKLSNLVLGKDIANREKIITTARQNLLFLLTSPNWRTMKSRLNAKLYNAAHNYALKLVAQTRGLAKRYPSMAIHFDGAPVFSYTYPYQAMTNNYYANLNQWNGQLGYAAESTNVVQAAEQLKIKTSSGRDAQLQRVLAMPGGLYQVMRIYLETSPSNDPELTSLIENAISKADIRKNVEAIQSTLTALDLSNINPFQNQANAYVYSRALIRLYENTHQEWALSLLLDTIPDLELPHVRVPHGLNGQPLVSPDRWAQLVDQQLLKRATFMQKSVIDDIQANKTAIMAGNPQVGVDEVMLAHQVFLGLKDSDSPQDVTAQLQRLALENTDPQSEAYKTLTFIATNRQAMAQQMKYGGGKDIELPLVSLDSSVNNFLLDQEFTEGKILTNIEASANPTSLGNLLRLNFLLKRPNEAIQAPIQIIIDMEEALKTEKNPQEQARKQQLIAVADQYLEFALRRYPERIGNMKFTPTPLFSGLSTQKAEQVLIQHFAHAPDSLGTNNLFRSGYFSYSRLAQIRNGFDHEGHTDFAKKIDLWAMERLMDEDFNTQTSISYGVYEKKENEFDSDAFAKSHYIIERLMNRQKGLVFSLPDLKKDTLEPLYQPLVDTARGRLVNDIADNPSDSLGFSLWGPFTPAPNLVLNSVPETDRPQLVDDTLTVEELGQILPVAGDQQGNVLNTLRSTTKGRLEILEQLVKLQDAGKMDDPLVAASRQQSWMPAIRDDVIANYSAGNLSESNKAAQDIYNRGLAILGLDNVRLRVIPDSKLPSEPNSTGELNRRGILQAGADIQSRREFRLIQNPGEAAATNEELDLTPVLKHVSDMDDANNGSDTPEQLGARAYVADLITKAHDPERKKELEELLALSDSIVENEIKKNSKFIPGYTLLDSSEEMIKFVPPYAWALLIVMISLLVKKIPLRYNWGRERKQYGTNIADIRLFARKNRIFEPPPEEKNKAMVALPSIDVNRIISSLPIGINRSLVYEPIYETLLALRENIKALQAIDLTEGPGLKDQLKQQFVLTNNILVLLERILRRMSFSPEWIKAEQEPPRNQLYQDSFNYFIVFAHQTLVELKKNFEDLDLEKLLKDKLIAETDIMRYLSGIDTLENELSYVTDDCLEELEDRGQVDYVNGYSNAWRSVEEMIGGYGFSRGVLMYNTPRDRAIQGLRNGWLPLMTKGSAIIPGLYGSWRFKSKEFKTEEDLYHLVRTVADYTGYEFPQDADPINWLNHVMREPGFGPKILEIMLSMDQDSSAYKAALEFQNKKEEFDAEKNRYLLEEFLPKLTPIGRYPYRTIQESERRLVDVLSTGARILSPMSAASSEITRRRNYLARTVTVGSMMVGTGLLIAMRFHKLNASPSVEAYILLEMVATIAVYWSTHLQLYFRAWKAKTELDNKQFISELRTKLDPNGLIKKKLEDKIAALKSVDPNFRELTANEQRIKAISIMEEDQQVIEELDPNNAPTFNKIAIVLQQENNQSMHDLNQYIKEVEAYVRDTLKGSNSPDRTIKAENFVEVIPSPKASGDGFFEAQEVLDPDPDSPDRTLYILHGIESRHDLSRIKRAIRKALVAGKNMSEGGAVVIGDQNDFDGPMIQSSNAYFTQIATMVNTEVASETEYVDTNVHRNGDSRVIGIQDEFHPETDKFEVNQFVGSSQITIMSKDGVKLAKEWGRRIKAAGLREYLNLHFGRDFLAPMAIMMNEDDPIKLDALISALAESRLNMPDIRQQFPHVHSSEVPYLQDQRFTQFKEFLQTSYEKGAAAIAGGVSYDDFEKALKTILRTERWITDPRSLILDDLKKTYRIMAQVIEQNMQEQETLLRPRYDAFLVHSGSGMYRLVTAADSASIARSNAGNGGIDLNYQPKFIRKFDHHFSTIGDTTMSGFSNDIKGFNFNIVRFTSNLSFSGALHLMYN